MPVDDPWFRAVERVPTRLFYRIAHGLVVTTSSGSAIEAGIVILALGVKPEVTLARAAGLEIGERGGIAVDDQMRTADPNVWAVGDAVEVRQVVTGQDAILPLAGPAQRQARVAIPDGRVLGAQAVGEEGVEKRIDVIATHIQYGGTVHDVAESELCYAPQYGAAKDPVNLAGMIARNHLDGDLPLAGWHEIDQADDTKTVIVDVREPSEFAAGSVAQAINMPLSKLRECFEELPNDRELWLLCGMGQRSYYAARMLCMRGYRVRLLSGGLMTYRAGVRGRRVVVTRRG